MRRSLRNLVVGACLLAFPLSASALDVRLDASQEVAPQRYESERMSFEYVTGQVVSRQVLKGDTGEVEQVTVQFVDPVSGERARDSFLSISVYERPPVVAGATSDEDALTQNVIAAVERGMGRKIAVQSDEMDVPGFGEVTGHHFELAEPAGKREGILFAKKVATGFVVVFFQLNPDDEKVQNSVYNIFESLSFGGK